MTAEAGIPDQDCMTVSQRVWHAGALWLLGFLAICLTTLVALAGIDMDTLSPELRKLGPAGVVAINLGSNGLILLVAVSIGALTAHRSGLVSLIAHRRRDYVSRLKGFPFYLVLGVALGLGIAWLDAYLFAHLPALAEMQKQIVHQREQAAASYEAGLVARFAYGGIVEEILLRWCLLSGLAWLILRLGAGRMVALWSAVGLSAFLFGVGHLPVLFKMFSNVPTEMVTRTVALNMAAGLAYGIAYTRNSLEAAMVMHASTHLGLLASATAAV